MSENTQISSLSESQISQAAMIFIQAEYEAIGMDTDSIQMNYIVHAGLKCSV
jgi:hypothetical protein